MLRFLVRRLLYSILVLFIISFVVFFIFFVVKGGTPTERAAQFAGKGATPTTIHDVEIRLGLDHPWYDQYRHYLDRLVFHADFGNDFINDAPVRSEITSRLPADLSLVFGAAFLWLAMGIPIGIVAATKPRSIRDRVSTFFALTFYSIPTFVLGLLLLLVFFYYFSHDLHLTWFEGLGPGTYDPITTNAYTWFRSLILPWFSLALVSAASYSRITRGSMLDVLGEDYIRTARAKGLPERKVIYRHGLRSALTPIVTILGIDIGTLIGGAVVTEVIFAIPGISQLSIKSVTNGDLPVIEATVLVAALFIVIANLIVDILYAVLDPRVRLA